jgi:hypothetical protein
MGILGQNKKLKSFIVLAQENDYNLATWNLELEASWN